MYNRWNRSADSRAFSIIMGKPTKKSIAEFALTLSDSECEEVTNTFHKQGPRLWGFWCNAMAERKKANMVVPKVWA